MAKGSGVPFDRRALLGAAAIAGVGVIGIGGFLFSEDVVGPWRLTARRMVDRLEFAAGGRFPGYRRNHAKGVAVSGYFDSNGNGGEVSKASVFRSGRYRLDGRFSLSGGNPHVPEEPGIVRGFGIRLWLPGGEQWRLAMIDIPVFIDATPEAFYTRTLAFAPDPATGKPDPDRLKQYLATHPETVAAMDIIRGNPPAPEFAAAAFYGLNAFECIDHSGRKTPVRWHLEPETTRAEMGSGGRGMFGPLAAQVRKGPVRWTLVLVVGVSGVDPTHDATKPWPRDRRRIPVGTVVVERVQTESPENVEAVSFDPLVLPDGIAPSDDPLLQARSAVYTESFRRRSAEATAPGAVTITEA
jgi:catalase